MTSSTRARAASLTRRSPLTTRETVERETPARRATASRFTEQTPSTPDRRRRTERLLGRGDRRDRCMVLWERSHGCGTEDSTGWGVVKIPTKMNLRDGSERRIRWLGLARVLGWFPQFHA